MMRTVSLIVCLAAALFSVSFQPAVDEGVQIAVLKYRGGGDWYANPTALPNLITFCNEQLGMKLHPEPATVEVGSPSLYNYPWIHMTGHGNVVFSDQEAENMRNYLLAGGFLHIDDNYGMDPFVRQAMQKVFPDKEWVELPFDHPIYRQHYRFASGLPKIHEHDGKPPRGYAILAEGRVVCFYTYECDLGDGWEDPEVHNDPPQKRQEALEMGANIMGFAFSR